MELCLGGHWGNSYHSPDFVTEFKRGEKGRGEFPLPKKI